MDCAWLRQATFCTFSAGLTRTGSSAPCLRRAQYREGLALLYLFNHELARAREVASEPILALIRLNWWREVVEGQAKHHEIATPLHAALAAGQFDARGSGRTDHGARGRG